MLASTITAVIVIPLEGLALLNGLNRFMREGGAIINLTRNTVATVVIAKSENEINVDIYLEVVEKKEVS